MKERPPESVATGLGIVFPYSPVPPRSCEPQSKESPPRIGWNFSFLAPLSGHDPAPKRAALSRTVPLYCFTYQAETRPVFVRSFLAILHTYISFPGLTPPFQRSNLRPKSGYRNLQAHTGNQVGGL
jgi:hypothetical protein